MLSIFPDVTVRVRLLVHVALLALSIYFGAPECQAQAPVAASIEIVRLANGAEYKGQIAEKVPGSHVVLVTLAGETKRFEWAEVAYAGVVEQPPVAEAAVPAPVAALVEPPAQAPPSDLVRVDLRASPHGVMWHAEDQSGSARTLCMAPCTAELKPGVYRLGLSAGMRETIWAPTRSKVEQGSSWNGEYRSRRGSRIAGGVILGVGIPAGLIAVIAGAASNNSADKACSSSELAGDACDEAGGESPGTPAIVVGSIVAIASAITGLVLSTRQDHASIRADLDDGSHPLEVMEPPPVSIEKGGYEPTLWACIADAEVRSVRLTIEVGKSGEIERVADVQDVSWGVRTCIKNNLPGQRAGGAKGPRTVLITR